MKKKLNVCLLNDSFPPVIDGVGNTVINYANIIKNKLGNAFVAVPDYPNAQDDYDFKVFRYPSLPTEKLSAGYRAGISTNIPNLAKLIDEDIDIIHTHCPLASTFLARCLRQVTNKPIVLTYHTKYDIEIQEAVHSKLLQKAATKVLIDNISACDEVWAVSKGAADSLKALGYKGKVIVMANGVDFEVGRVPQERIDEIRKQYHIKDGVITYLFVGRMKWYKGIKIILDALKMLDNNHKDFQMVFVGNGENFDDIQHYAKSLGLQDKCIYTNAIYDREVLKAIYCACDLFLFPSSFDTNGIVVREAAASSVGSVLIKGSCAAEDVIDGQNAILIEENAQAMFEVLNNHDVKYFHQIGENAMHEIYISWEDAIKKAYKRYQYIINNYKPKEDNTLVDFPLHLISESANALSLVRRMQLAFKNIHEYASEQIHDVMDRYL